MSQKRRQQACLVNIKHVIKERDTAVYSLILSFGSPLKDL